MIHFTVTGKGPFPFALLQQEQCWPQAPSEADLMAGEAERTIKLATNTPTAPNVDLWSAVGWNVNAHD